MKLREIVLEGFLLGSLGIGVGTGSAYVIMAMPNAWTQVGATVAIFSVVTGVWKYTDKRLELFLDKRTEFSKEIFSLINGEDKLREWLDSDPEKSYQLVHDLIEEYYSLKEPIVSLSFVMNEIWKQAETRSNASVSKGQKPDCSAEDLCRELLLRRISVKYGQEALTNLRPILEEIITEKYGQEVLEEEWLTEFLQNSEYHLLIYEALESEVSGDIADLSAAIIVRLKRFASQS